jgi:hypothetical protein
MNEGRTDRIVRAALGIIALVVSLIIDPMAWKIVLWILAGILLITAAVGFCPLYFVLHLNTKPKTH